MGYNIEKAALAEYIKTQIVAMNALLIGQNCPILIKPDIDTNSPNWEDFARYFSKPMLDDLEKK